MSDTGAPKMGAERLRDLDVLDEFGAPVRLGNLWLDQVAVLVFVRHFG